MRLRDFDYSLPKELIAQSPLKRRDSSRLMVVDRKNKAVFHKSFRDIADYLGREDLLALNNTRVIPARLLGFKKDTLGKVDALLIKRISSNRFEALIKPGLRIGQSVLFNQGAIKAELIDRGILEFNKHISLALLEEIGVMPLPPYIKRQPVKKDLVSYQTVYSKNPGAIAAPTAGLHFSREVLGKIKEKKTAINYLSLHVGIGTFKPVKCDDIRNHTVEAEEFSIPPETVRALIENRKAGGRIFAVGTTTARALETIGADAAQLRDYQKTGCKGKTDLFIYPGYEFKAADCLLTNFHLPKTTLFMLVCAFASRDLILRAYQEAIREKYRFYSYGDAMLII